MNNRRRNRNKERNKIVAALIAFFLGGLGIHHFYLGDKKRGFIYLLFFWTAIPRIISIFEAIRYLVISEEDFDMQYNQEFQEWNYQTRRERRSERREYREARADTRTSTRRRRRATSAEDHKVKRKRRRNPEFTRRNRKERSKVQPGQTHRSEGIRKFKEYDIQGAIVDFEKALKAAPSDPATHFNLSCAYSLTENKEESFYHLSKAVKHGFSDKERIQTHEALAFMRIQDNWNEFVERGYTLSGEKEKEDNHTHEPKSSVPDDLLDQLNKLKDLRDRGLLTNEEFINQKEKLKN